MKQPVVGLRSEPKLSPREHGAYGQLFAPLVTALLGGCPTVSGVCFAASAVSAFFAHEPWLVIVGQRGTRAERTLASRAKRRLACLLAATAILGIAGLILANRATKIAGLSVAMLALVAGTLSHFDKLHSAFGEVWAGTVLAALGIPVSLACGVSIELALGNAFAWSLAFASGVFAVRAIIQRRKSGTRGRGLWAILAIVLLLVTQSRFTLGPVLAVSPLALAAVALFAVAPSPKALRKVGWTLVGFTVAAALAMALNARAHFASTRCRALRPSLENPGKIDAMTARKRPFPA